MRSAFGIGIPIVVIATLGCGGSNPAIKAGPMPESGSFTGVYFSPQYGEMHLSQTGSAVIGQYKRDERTGKIQGEAQGDVMRFEWKEYKAMVSNRPQETRGHGYFRYMIDASNGDHVLKGRWGLDEDDGNGGEWNAYKSRTRQPELESEPTGAAHGGERSSDN
jgi:hypothetical protein